MTSTDTQTPSGKTAEVLERHIESLNHEFALGIPNPKWQSPSSRPVTERSKEEQCRVWVKYLFWKNTEAFERALNGFREQVRSEIREGKQWVHKPNQEYGTVPSREDFIRTNDNYRNQVSTEERVKRVDTLWKFLHSETWIEQGGENPLEGSQSSPRPRNLANGPPRDSLNGNLEESPAVITPQAKRKASNNQEVFYTAPSSPVLPFEGQYPSLGNLDEDNISMRNEPNLNTDTLDGTDKLKVEAQRSRSSIKRQSKITDHMFITKSYPQNHPPARKPAPPLPRNDASSFGMVGPSTSPEVSFATTREDSIFDRSEAPRYQGTSFETTITEPCDETATQPDSVDGLMMSEEFSMMLKSVERNASTSFETERRPLYKEQEIVEDLIYSGPFSKDRECFSEKVLLRARYELERVKQVWDVSPKQILVGNKPYEKHSDFWQWLGDVGRRMNKTLPEKPSVKAWNAAIGRFEGDRHSEAVIFSGSLDWCEKNEPGVFKLKLNPLKIDRTCRFYRRFGSDRFLSITMPSPSQPPSHLRLKDQTSLREVLADWLVNSNHYLLKRTWKAFYVDDFKTKSKSKTGKPRVRVDFFAVDGSDFTTRLSPPILSPINETSESHTRMTVGQLIQWHIPLDANRSQTDCKLFNRIGLALSKTWATVVIQPHQFLKLSDPLGKPVMNDGCALMSRPLARAICAELGIDGITPSTFQGRIAGAKGLWMVDRDLDDDKGFWIQISDSQLKVKPHPCDFFGHVDEEKITFEVASWSKPLRSSELNTQLLEVLNNRGQVRKRVADIAREAIRDIYKEFENVMERNSIPLARALIQKIRPTADDGYSRTNIRRIDQWLSQTIESVIRFLEAGFSPRDFPPLRERMRICLNDTLNRYVNELHIPIPLSTYAYCIADPYGVLEENEVHFAFSGQWRDCSYFDDAMVDGADVLVGRTPAHCPWDIQRRRAVWKSELRHFKDVIVFSTRGTTPLASLLSGGDYDGDRPWICWDQGIVETFTNTFPPLEESGPEHFGLVKHAQPMSTVGSVGDFLRNAFKFNLAMSNLGRCTVEHEKLSYDEKEGISSPLSLELATLLSHLVDSKKSGLQLTEEQWSRYRKSISPRERGVPAYKNLAAKEGKRDNINDFLRFEVAFQEKEEALRNFNKRFDGVDDIRDESLLLPWQAAVARAELEKQEDPETNGHSNIGLVKGSALYEMLKSIEVQIKEARDKWTKGCHCQKTAETSTGFKIQLAAELLNRIQPPDICHPLVHTWQNSEYEWRVLMASGAYYFHWRSAFPLYAAGETLCWIKIGKEPARLIRDQVYVSMKVSSSAARRLAGAEAEELANEEVEWNVESDGDDSEEFDRESVVDALNEIDRMHQNLH
ncbi:RNA-directed RNA polymerase, putative [Talaromyces marneffei ATCC 18224]|uniref:RNA-dependent RNA polymerase n=1 Tax=Talaromyces marneffei (strain ATCC 18224 / CBS 334.59 / QM 7333) TaxID=441960 RepID=B6QEC4_TALMQ|nr:RNA-directed RNA polymerase, putative [Talaromyces marneffei ATCC 18224]